MNPIWQRAGPGDRSRTKPRSRAVAFLLHFRGFERFPKTLDQQRSLLRRCCTLQPLRRPSPHRGLRFGVVGVPRNHMPVDMRDNVAQTLIVDPHRPKDLPLRGCHPRDIPPKRLLAGDRQLGQMLRMVLQNQNAPPRAPLVFTQDAVGLRQFGNHRRVSSIGATGHGRTQRTTRSAGHMR